MGRLGNVFESENVGKCEIVKGLSFAIRIDVARKVVNHLEAGIVVLSNVYDEEWFNVGHERYGLYVNDCPLLE